MEAMREVFKNCQVDMRLYGVERSNVDTVGEENFLERTMREFGERMGRGTALAYYDGIENEYYNTEQALRGFFKDKNIVRAVEIGTYRGMSSAVLAHYVKKELVTIDIYLDSIAVALWTWCGMKKKIYYCIVENDAMKKAFLDDTNFDFAFIDGMHDAESVKRDFEMTKKCGRVLFHDYGIRHCPGIKEFVDTLPKDEVTIQMPFAYWEKNGQKM